MVVAFLKLPLSAVVIATALTISAGLTVGPLIIIGVTVAYLATLGLEGRLGAAAAPACRPTARPWVPPPDVRSPRRARHEIAVMALTNTRTAQAFVQYVAGPKGQRVLASYGFPPPT